MFALTTWFADRWERERKRREIAELEELARVLLVIYGTGPFAVPGGQRDGRARAVSIDIQTGKTMS
jgi:hypothetical protein